ncbi:hypothetical protein FHX42_002210 [Saccharopolyspora lacisalsi]|uniref:Glycosyltransferase 2-like domain-containing protein n=1 Tax=Halosaccharopolyspora lacisalsi TaxID=1000566 RepID=A0A839DUY6_9PSEU|nr:glycosyltransferase [Halosaccharopolyspora lacisalsi]MBA8824863.1 hypothetical protein [Halosaccharopolyspora lacisalsi]
MSEAEIRYTVVVPTTGRATLGELLAALPSSPPPEEVVVVDDRPGERDELLLPDGTVSMRVLSSGGRGPAGARNVGWRAAGTPWVVFLDDDVVPTPEWGPALRRDLEEASDEVAGSQGRIVVPLPRHRAPTDLERGTAGLAGAWWITADMAYRSHALAEVGGFDERFPRAYREDADLALRVRARGYRLTWGTRRTLHPVRPAGFLASLWAQAGNADNAAMRRKYGPSWRRHSGEGPGRTARHAITTGAALVATGGAVRAGRGAVTATATVVWLGLTAEFAWRRIAPGPRTPAEIARMVVTSAAIPPAACWHRLRGEIRARPRETTRDDSAEAGRDRTHGTAAPEVTRPVGRAREAVR